MKILKVSKKKKKIPMNLLIFIYVNELLNEEMLKVTIEIVC